MISIKSAAPDQIIVTHVSPLGVQVVADSKAQTLQWDSLYDLVGGNFDLRKYPNMIPSGPWGNALREAMRKAKDAPIRMMEILPHPYNEVRVETAAGEYVGQELGKDWGCTQHANYRLAKQEADALRKLYEKRNFQVVIKA